MVAPTHENKMSTTTPSPAEPAPPALYHAPEHSAVNSEPGKDAAHHPDLQPQARVHPEFHQPPPNYPGFQQQQQQQQQHQPGLQSPVNHHHPPQNHPRFHQPVQQQPGPHPNHHPGLYHPGLQHGPYPPALHQQGMYQQLDPQQPAIQRAYYQPGSQPQPQPGPPFPHSHPPHHPHPHPHAHSHPHSLPQQHQQQQQPQPPAPSSQNVQQQQPKAAPKTPPHSPRHRYLTRDQRLQIMTLHSAGHTQLFIAQQLHITSRQVGYTIRSGSLTPKKRSGRPQKLSEAQCDELERYISGNGPAPSGLNEEGWEEGRYMSYEKLAKGPFANWGVGEYAVRGVLRKRGYVRVGRELVKRVSDTPKAKKRVRKSKVPVTTATIAMDEEDGEGDEDDDEGIDDGEGDEDDAQDVVLDRAAPLSSVVVGAPGLAMTAGSNPNPNINPRAFGAMAPIAPMAAMGRVGGDADSQATSSPGENKRSLTSVAGTQPGLQRVS